MAGYLVILGLVAENQPWGRGWFHDLKHYLNQKDPSFSAPEENSPGMRKLQAKIDAWYPQILERYPRLNVEYKNVPDDQNGFLKILEWQEEVLLPMEEGSMKGVLFELPTKFLDPIDWDHLLAHPKEIESFLAPKQPILDRAIAIGLLPDQSVKGISPNRYLFRNITFDTKIVEHLRLKAIAEANRGDAKAALKTLRAIRGWTTHYSDTEAPFLMTTTIALGIRLGLQSTIQEQILPRLAEEEIDYAQWAELTKSGQDIQQQWLNMWRGEWHVISTSKWYTNILAQENLRDPMAFLSASAAVSNSLCNPDILCKLDTWTPPPPPHSLTRKSRDFYNIQLVDSMFSEFGKGMIKNHARLQQYEIAFTLRKLEAEGHDLKSLDQATRDSLPLQILPGIDLAIDFDERSISVPEGRFQRAKPLTF